MSGFFLFLLVAAAVLLLFIVIVVRRRTGLHGPEWESGIADRPPPPRVMPQYRSLVAALDAIRKDDPEFSFVLFEDFLYALYAEAHAARGAGRLESLAPYLSSSARGALTSLGARVSEVRTVIIGGLRVDRVTVGGSDQPTEAVAEIEANYAEIADGGAEHGYYARERWTLSRPPGAKSRPPARARIVDCPNCGAPLDKILGGVCGHCNQDVSRGDLDWNVASIEVLERQERGPILTGDVEEVGTSDPTVIAPDVKQRWEDLTTRDRALDWASLTARIGLVYRSFHEAWTKREPLLVRGYLSDNLFQSQLYWIEAYRSQGLVNRTDGSHIVSIQLARIVSDARFDAITVRVFATGLDYTVDETGNVVAGSKDRERAYSEYWTLIRGIDRTGTAPRTAPECPNCGASLDVTMAGTCKYCSAKVTSGEFDWVLSRIEQDEVYGG